MFLASTRYFFFLILSFMTCFGSDKEKNNKEKITQAAGSGILGYATYQGTMLGSVAAHELGHAVSGAALLKTLPSGAGFSFSPLSIAPVCAHVAYSPESAMARALERVETGRASSLSPLTKIKLGLTLQAGPLAGMAASVMALKIPGIYENYQKTGNLVSSIKNEMNKPVNFKELGWGLILGSYMSFFLNAANMVAQQYSLFSDTKTRCNPYGEIPLDGAKFAELLPQKFRIPYARAVSTGLTGLTIYGPYSLAKIYKEKKNSQADNNK